MKLAFEVEVPFEIPTLRFVLERDHRQGGAGCLLLSCYMDKGPDMYALALRFKSLDEVGKHAQLLAQSAAWTNEFLERWPRNPETGQTPWDDTGEQARFLDGKPLFVYCQQGQAACLDSTENWKAA